jgi:iron complex transport system permease protein
MEKRRMRLCVTAAVFLLLTAALAIMNITIGSVKTPDHDIIWKIRLPRMTASGILGGALALSGFLLQAFFNNPIAGPYVLGISHGAKLSVALVMIAFLSRRISISSTAMILAAFLGAIAVTGFILIFARNVRGSSMLIVCGVMAGYICSAVTDFITAFADDASIVNLHNWSRGSFSGTSWENVRVMAVVTLIASAATFMLSKPLGAYQLGESYAKSVGVGVKALRAGIITLSSLLCAVVTAFAGPISFVGIAAPHLVKSFLKTSKPLIIIPMCFWCGSLFCMGCDLIARTVFAPTELSVSSVTAAIGAPIVIRIMLRKRENRQ